ncbi:uncharacterized protein METZ01_LOCUS349840, partial [marine metagenome]
RETTIIDGNQNGSVVTFNSGESSTAALTGFTIQNGFAQGSSWPNFNGGGILCYNNSDPTLTNVTISDNSAERGGGGIYCYQSSPSLVNVTITGNSAETDGGGIWCYDFSSSLVNVTISGNTASDEGGGIYCYGSNPSLVNVTITGNTAASNGGGIYCRESNPSLVNCILWNDSPQEIYIQSGSVTATYSNIQSGWTGIGNIDANPLFCNPDSGDYSLASNSPALGSGEGGANMGAFGVGCEALLLAPVLSDIDDQQITEDGVLTLVFSATSDINASMSFTATSDTSDVSVTMDSTTLTATPAPDWNGSSLITVIVIDENEL